MLNYASALVNPHDVAEACVPSMPAIPSYKAKVFRKGTFLVNSSGAGYVACQPGTVIGNAGDYDKYVVWTEGTQIGTTITTDPTITGISSANSNSPFNAGDMGNDGVNARLVACGIRVRYIGTELNRAGRMIVLEQPNHHSLDGLPISSLLAYDRSRTQPVSREWTYVSFQPVSQAELNYQSDGISLGGKTVHCLAICVLGAVDGSAFEFEATSHIEFTGTAARGKTATPASNYFQSVLAFVGNLNSQQLNTLAKAGTSVGNMLRNHYLGNTAMNQRMLEL